MSCTVLCCHVFIFCLQAACNSSPGSLKVFQSLSLDISGFILYFNISSYLSLIKFVEQVQDKRRGRTKNTSTADELYVKVTSLRNRKESSKRPDKDPGGVSGPAADPSAAHQSIIRKCFRRRMAVKKLFFKKRNGEKRLRYAKLHKNWAKNLWQQIL